MVLNDFSGGKNSRVEPSLLQPTQAQVYNNLDNTSGALKPIKGNTLNSNGFNKYFKWYEAGQEFLSENTETSYVEYQDIMYKTNFNSYPTKYDGTSEYRLGIVGPTFLPVINTSGVGILTGTYYYTFTYYDANTGTESQPAPISTGLTVSSNTILVSQINASADPQVTNIRIYRIGGSLTKYTLVATVLNTNADYSDNIADIDIAGNNKLDTFAAVEAPDDLKYLHEAYAMLFGAVGDKLHYSDIAEPNSWPITNFIDFDSAITGISSIQSGVLVFTKFKTYLITGNSPGTFSKLLLDGEQGCVSHYSISFTNNNLIWLSLDGICMTTGGAIEVVSLPVLGEFILTGLNNSAVINRAYYLSHDSGILIFDFKYNTIVRELDGVVDWLDKHDDTLYCIIGSDIYSMFDGADLKYTYKSPVITDGSYTIRKDYKDFYIKYEGEINLKVYVDKELVNEKDLDGDECYNLKALSSASGYGLEIEITGTGKVNEIEYKVQGRQNGR